MNDSADKKQFTTSLEAELTTLALVLPEDFVARCWQHFELMRLWAAKMNLTAVQSVEQATSLHYVDSLLFLAVLDRSLGDVLSLTDVGSGAGFPGLVLALARPLWQIRLLEPQRKRASFLRRALGQLDRTDVDVVEGRLERARPSSKDDSLKQVAGSIDWQTDILVSRATLPVPELIEWGANRLGSGGQLVLSQGKGALDTQALEVLATTHGLKLERRQHFTLQAGHQRILDVLGKAFRIDQTEAPR